MITLKEETFINAPAKSVFGFLTHIDLLYKTWHPKDHVFCKTISGTLSKKGCVFHFLEVIGRFPIYSIVKVSELKSDEYIEYSPIFPFSLLRIGKGYFRIETLSKNKSKLIAYTEYGDKSGIIDRMANLVIKASDIRKHMREEGINLKIYLESQK